MAGKKDHCCQAWVPADPCRVQGSQTVVPDAHKQICYFQERDIHLQT